MRPGLLVPNTRHAGIAVYRVTSTKLKTLYRSLSLASTTPPHSDFEDRFGLLVDAEWAAREQRKLQRRLHSAKLRYPMTLEAVPVEVAHRMH